MATYYFDGSDAGASDPNTAWSNDANAFDGSIETTANTTTKGTTSANYLMAEGTNAPSSGHDIIGVKARIYGAVAGGVNPFLEATIYTNGLVQSLISVSTVSSTLGWSAYSAFLTVPTGGWLWSVIQALEIKIYANNDSGSLTTVNPYRAEVLVVTSPYPQSLYRIQNFS